MRVKKLLATLCATCLLMTGCGSDSSSENKDPTSQATIIKLGMITHLNASEKQMEDYLFKVQEKSRAKVVNHVPVFFDSLRLMQLGIESGKVDVISTYKSVAEYLIANNDHYELVHDNWTKGLKDNFCFAVHEDDDKLEADLNNIIKDMKADGSLNKLVTEYITNVDKGQAPPKVDLPKFDSADKIVVGVTGDLPPLDLILPDNSPAGFNTALLAEIAKRLGKNIEIVQIDSGARAAALAAEQVDVIFWAIVPVNDAFPKDIDKPNDIALSEPYFQDEIAHVKLKN